MRKTAIFLILFIFTASYVFAKDVRNTAINLYPQANMAPSKPDNLALSECYRLALRQSEVIAIDEALIREADAHFVQALGEVLPHVSFKSTDFQEEEVLVGGTSGSTFTSLKPSKSSTRRFNATQTLFNGFKAIAAVTGSKFEKRQRTKEKIRAEQLLLLDVANSFYLLQELREDLKSLYTIRRALDDRIDELIKRDKLGRSRPSEVVNAKAQFYIVESQIELQKSKERIARQLLEFLIGRPVYQLADTYEIPSPLPPEKEYVARAYLRPDVEALENAWRLQKKNVQVVSSELLPEASLDANYYAQRTGFDKGTDWDVSLIISVPLFDSEALGKSQAASLKAREAELEYLRAKRRAPWDIKDAYVALDTAISIQNVLRKVYTTSRLNYHLQKKDYERSLVNNLDVLAAIQTLEDAERNYIHAFYESKRLYWKLRVAAGDNVEEALK